MPGAQRRARDCPPSLCSPDRFVLQRWLYPTSIPAKTWKLPFKNARLPREHPTRNAPSAERTCQGGTQRGCHPIPVTSPPRSEPFPLFLEAVNGICRITVRKRHGTTGTPLQKRSCCSTGLTGEFRDGKRLPPRDPDRKQPYPEVACARS
jgi:hypothetical protein